MVETIHERIERLVKEYGGGKNTVFAHKVGVSEGNVRGYIKGVMPKYDVLEKIVRYLDVDPTWLLTGKGEIHRDQQQTATTESTVIYKSDPKDAAIITAKDEAIAAKDITISTLRDRIKDLETKLSGQPLGLRSAPAADTPSGGGCQTSPK